MHVSVLPFVCAIALERSNLLRKARVRNTGQNMTEGRVSCTRGTYSGKGGEQRHFLIPKRASILSRRSDVVWVCYVVVSKNV